MNTVMIRWSSLLRLTELEFVPEPPKVIKMTDELIQTLSWLTAATPHDRKFLRCNELGALLVGNAWDNLQAVEDDELAPVSGTPDTFTHSVVNQGILIATGGEIVKITVTLADEATTETFYLPADTVYFYPRGVHGISIAVVPDPEGTGSYVGITAYN